MTCLLFVFLYARILNLAKAFSERTGVKLDGLSPAEAKAVIMQADRPGFTSMADSGMMFGEKLDGVGLTDKAGAAEAFENTNANFYVAPNGKILPAKYKDWLGMNQRDSLMNSVSDNKLKNAIGEIYRPGSIIGDGGTANIIRFERETGILLSKSGHIQKAIDMSKYFQKLIDSGTLSDDNLKIAKDILEDLQNALGGK